MRRARFKVVGRFDGASSATVLIEYRDPATAFLSVRPYRRRKAYELLLSDVARGVIFDVVRKELAEKRAAKGRKR